MTLPDYTLSLSLENLHQPDGGGDLGDLLDLSPNHTRGSIERESLFVPFAAEERYRSLVIGIFVYVAYGTYLRGALQVHLREFGNPIRARVCKTRSLWRQCSHDP